MLGNEAVSVFYGRNKFLVDGDLHHIKVSLERVGAPGLACIKSLHITSYSNLDSDSDCESDYDSEHGFDTSTTVASDTALSIQCWAEICERLGATLTPGLVDFSLWSPMSTLSKAKQIVEPMRMLPTLRQCSVVLMMMCCGPACISLCYDCEVDCRLVEALCEELVVDATRRTQPFPFERLPPEIRRHILSLTGLVPAPEAILHHQENTIVSRGRIYHKLQCCGNCSDGLLYRQTSVRKCALCHPMTKICYCQSGAYSTRCTCRRIPTALFALNRALSAEVYHLFYTQNRFIFRDHPHDILKFLQSIPFGTLKLFRKIGFYLPPCVQDEFLQFPEEVSRQWWSLIEFVQENLELDKVFLSIYAHDFSIQTFCDISDDELLFEDLVVDNFLDTLNHPVNELESMLVTPLQLLRGLKDFFLVLSYNIDLEEQTEKRVMGDRYRERHIIERFKLDIDYRNI